VPKKKGVEFASLLHQVGADYHASPFLPQTRAILLEIAPDAQPRLPKRGARKSPKQAISDDAEAEHSPDPESGGTKRMTPKRSSAPKNSTGAPKKPQGPPHKKAPAEKKSPSTQLARRKPR
jgi:hypothetical protein